MVLSSASNRAAGNDSDTRVAGCLLTGIPGLEHLHIWLSIPFCTIYEVALAGNGILICVILSQPGLHEPMYVFLAMLASADILLSTSTMPKALANFWLGYSHISFDGCLTQMFFIHFLFVADSAVLMAMAFDRFVAICFPLRYTTVLTSLVIGKIVAAALTRGFIIMFLSIFLLKRLYYCRINVIAHTWASTWALPICPVPISPSMSGMGWQLLYFSQAWTSFLSLFPTFISSKPSSTSLLAMPGPRP